MAITITLTAGDKPQDVGVGYTVWGVSYSNLAGQFLWLGANRYAAPYSRGTFYVDGEDRGHVEWKAPPNTAQPPSTASQLASVTFSPLPLWDSGTASAPKGLYYDRNPTTFMFQYLSPNIAPHVANARFAYTVPTSRKAYLEEMMCVTELEAAGDLAATPSVGFAVSYIFITPFGAVGKTSMLAYIQDTAPNRSRADALVGASMELQAGDLAQGTTVNTYTATKAFHSLNMKVTEFDA